MGTNWFKNLILRRHLTEEELKDIPYPRVELHTHVMYKTIQVGTILGMGVIAPVVALIRKKPFAKTVVRYGRNGLIFGVIAGPIMTEATPQGKKATDESVWDRCYRLRHNKNQVRTDQYASFCALGGATATGIMGQGPLTGAVIGFATGTI